MNKDKNQENTQETAESTPEDHQQSQQQAEAVDVWGLLRYCVLLLHSHAWQSMGLVPDSSTGKIEKKLDQAIVAIDAVAFLLGQLEAKLSSREQREFQSMLSDLRLNFVQQQKIADNEPASEA